MKREEFIALLFFLGILSALPFFSKKKSSLQSTELASEEPILPIEDEKVKGIYVPGWKGVNKENIDEVMCDMYECGLNTLMIDIKNARGELFYSPKNSLAREIDSQVKTIGGSYRKLNLDYLLEQADIFDIRLIGRHVMFMDHNLYNSRKDLRLWEKNHEKWVDMRNKEVIDYNIELLHEESDIGFDEIVLDYIRFPSVNRFGSENEKCDVIDNISENTRNKLLNKDIDLSVQVFGYSAWHHDKSQVGQRIPTLSPHFDVIYPMLYPSHFWPGSFGYDDPSKYPYEFIQMGYDQAMKKINGDVKIIPMIQAFWYGSGDINAQINAVEDCDMPGYVCWNSKGEYENLHRAIKPSFL